jgi:hypothetical protein
VLYIVGFLAGQLGVCIQFLVLGSIELFIHVLLLSVSILSHARPVGIRYNLNTKEKYTNYVLRYENMFYIHRYKYFVESCCLHIQNRDCERIKLCLLLKYH